MHVCGAALVLFFLLNFLWQLMQLSWMASAWYSISLAVISFLETFLAFISFFRSPGICPGNLVALDAALHIIAEFQVV